MGVLGAVFPVSGGKKHRGRCGRTGAIWEEIPAALGAPGCHPRCIRVRGSRPSPTARRTGHPLILVMPARSKAWATRHERGDWGDGHSKDHEASGRNAHHYGGVWRRCRKRNKRWYSRPDGRLKDVSDEISDLSAGPRSAPFPLVCGGCGAKRKSHGAISLPPTPSAPLRAGSSQNARRMGQPPAW
jgi:hypothetical protein